MRRMWMFRPAALALALGAGAASLRAQSLDEGREALLAGRYAEALRVLERVPAGGDEGIEAQRLLVRALRTVGRYDDAAAAARRATGAGGTGGRELWNALGEALVDRGRLADADAAFRRAMSEGASDSLTAALNLAVLHYERGEVERAMKEFDGIVDLFNGGKRRFTARDMAAVATACRYLGVNDPQRFRDALSAFDRAIALDGEDPDPRVALGELFLEKYNAADAKTTFDEVLSTNPNEPRALLGAARRASFDGQRGVDSLVARALAVNPNFVEARVFRAQLALDLEDYAAARRELERALEVNPASSRALAGLAAVHALTGNGGGARYDEAVRRALALNPRDAELFSTLAELTARVRRYRQAAELAKRAVALDPTSWRGWALLGMNQLRLGDIAAGKASLARAFAGDPYDVWVKNTLDLLDTFGNYDETRSAHYVFMIEKSESELLSIYLRDLAEQAWDTFVARYGYTPPAPVRIEVYRSHADFSVRTVGLAGLGALGVSFGTTLAFDSPAAKDAGAFNWGSTVWHELAHTFTLGATDHRIPRWFSEGLSVYEEHRARPGWGFGPSPSFLVAFAQRRLVPVSRMNDGFMHPAYPEQVQHSYYQASLVCELIARDHGGDAAIRRMLDGYRAGLTTEQVFRQVLKTDPTSFDQTFNEYVRQRFATPLAALSGSSPPMRPGDAVERARRAPGDLLLQLEAGRTLFEAKRYDEAIPFLERAKAQFPEYGGDGNAYWYLAQIREAKGDLRGAARELATLVKTSEAPYPAHVRLADLLVKLGDSTGAAAALERAMYIDPYERAQHERLAALYRALGAREKAVRERRAVVALAPVDRASALYELARAQQEAGDAAGARRSVLRSLEEAPNYPEAQMLLLHLYDARQSGAGKKP